MKIYRTRLSINERIKYFFYFSISIKNTHGLTFNTSASAQIPLMDKCCPALSLLIVGIERPVRLLRYSVEYEEALINLLTLKLTTSSN